MAEKPQTLADYLGTPLLGPERDDLERIEDPKEFGLTVINSVEFRRYILLGLTLGTLPGFTSILGRLMDHALGKPVEHVEVVDKSIPVESMTADQLEDRAQRLAEMAKFMRRAEQFDEPPGSDSVH